MRRMLLTGMSGTGKSTVIGELRRRGYRAVDLDCDEYSHWADVDVTAAGSPVEPGRDWVWRENRVAELLAQTHDDPLFVSGCAPNMGSFLRLFDRVVLLTAPTDVISRRLDVRGPREYGSRPRELGRALALVESVEPALRRVATDEIDASAPLEDVLQAVLGLARPV